MFTFLNQSYCVTMEYRITFYLDSKIFHIKSEIIKDIKEA